MEITDETLPQLTDEGSFVKFFGDFSKSIFAEARLYPSISSVRVKEAHGAWRNDLDRVGTNESNLREEGLDHFKQCGDLAFWVRRMSPIVEAIDLTQNEADAPGYPISRDEEAFRDLLFGYHNEYMAFEIGYQFCRFYELSDPMPSQRADSLILTDDYYKTMCHFLKYKTVSPHAMFLIYKSLFLR